MPGPTRVLHYSTWGERCGISAYCENLVRELARLGVRGDPAPVDRVGSAYLSPTEWRAKLEAVADRAADYDLLHLQHEFSFFGPVDRLAEGNRHFFRLMDRLRRAGRPTVVTFHTMPDFLPRRPTRVQKLKALLPAWWFGWAPRRTLGRAGRPVRAVVHTRRSRLQLIRAGVDERLIRVVPHGVVRRSDVLRRVSAAEAKARLGLPPDATVLSLFGFVAEYKGHLDAVRALERLPDRFVLAVVGGPHPEAQDRTLHRMLKMWKGDPRRLVVTGHLPADAVDLYHAATDVCLAPYNDPSLASSAAITWAVSSGKPVIATTIPTFRELAAAHHCLRLCNPHSPCELAWTIRNLADDPAGREELVRNAAAYCEQSAWPVAARRVADVYAELLGRPVCEAGAPAPHLRAA